MYKNKFYVKNDVSYDEYNFTKIASNANIAPKIIMYKKNILVTKLYKYTLYDYINEFGMSNKLDKNIQLLIDKLHNLDIFHSDLHSLNIVLNNEDDIRIIDFGGAVYMSEINTINFYIYVENFKNENLIEYEKSIYKIEFDSEN